MKIIQSQLLGRISASLFALAVLIEPSVNEKGRSAWARQEGAHSIVLASAPAFYQPVEADFRPIYDADATNKSREPWGGDSGYWTWVLRFYKGYTKDYFLVKVAMPGWNDEAAKLLNGIAPKDRRILVDRFNRTGRSVAGEWSKDNGVRRIDTEDLKHWSEQLKASTENLSDEKKTIKLKTCLDQIDREIAKKLTSAIRSR